MYCSNCKSEVAENAKLCSECGQEIKGALPQQVTEDQSELGNNRSKVDSPSAEHPHGVESYSSDIQPAMDHPLEAGDQALEGQVEILNQPADHQPGQANLLSKLGQYIQQHKLLTGGVIGAFALAMLVILLLLPLFQTKKLPIILLGENELSMQISDNQEPVRLSKMIMEDWEWDWDWTSNHFLHYNIQLNEKRDKLFFIKHIDEEESATLYYRDLKKNPSSWGREQGVELASNINHVNGITFTVSSSGKNVLYIKNYAGEAGGDFYIHNLTKEELIDSQVEDYWYTDDLALIYYTKVNDETNETDLYYVYTNKWKDKVKAASDIHSVYQIDDKNGTIYYTTKILGQASNDKRLHKKSVGKEAVELVSGISGIVSLVEENSFFYTESVREEIQLSTLVEDDLIESDADIQEPSIADYITIEENVEHINWWTGEIYYQDVERTDYRSYNDADDRYEAKVRRDRLRKELSKETHQVESFNLYYYHDGKSTKLAENFDYSTYRNVIDGTITYSKKSAESFEKLLISEIKNTSDVTAAYDLAYTDSTSYISTKQAIDVKIGEDEERLIVDGLTSDGKMLYGREKKDYTTYTLVSYDIIDGKPSNRKVLDEDVRYSQYFPEFSKLFYYKGTDINYADLYVFDNGKSTKIATGVLMWYARYYDEDGTIFYYTFYNEDEGTGTLNRYKDGKSTSIAKGVRDYYYLESEGLYYITDFNSERKLGTLMKAANKGDDIFVADHVNEMFVPEHNWYGF